MNLVDPWNVAFLVGFLIYVGTRHHFERRVAAERGDDAPTPSEAPAAERPLLGLVMLGSLLIPVLYLLTPLFAFADRPTPHALRAGGTVVLVGALWLFWRSHADLGRNWSVTLDLRSEHELVTRGVYRRMRHPMYAAIWAFAVAQAMILPNWVAGFSALVTFAPLYFVRVPREEAMMRREFGDAYTEYEGRTWRVLPRP